MKLTKISPQILAFKCKNKKEMTMTFFRVQEFYEAANPKLRGGVFDTFRFLDLMVADDGKFSYFSDWSGFNFPSNVYHEWRRLNPTPTPYEQKLIAMIERAVPAGKPFYVVAMLETAKDTLEHELAHAMFFLDPEYRKTATALVRRMPAGLKRKMVAGLTRLGYTRAVFVDEINAYLSTSNARYLAKRFKTVRADLVGQPPFKSAFTTASGRYSR